MPGWATLMLIAPFAGRLISRFGERTLIAGGLTAFAAALIWIALIARTGLPYADLVIPLILAGTGVSVAIPPTQSVVMTSVAPQYIGRASGTFNMLRQLGGVFGIAICAAVFAAHGGYASAAAFTSGFGPAMGACAALALLGALASLALPRRRAAAANLLLVPNSGELYDPAERELKGDPNEARPEDVNPDAQETWASDGASAAQSVAQQNQSSNPDLQTVSDEVSADEVGSLLTDDLKALDAGTEDYDADLCQSIGDAIEKFGQALDFYNNLSNVVVYFDGLAAAYNSRAPLDMANAITDAQNKFQQELGTCVDNLDTIHWIIEQIQNIFCNEGE